MKKIMVWLLVLALATTAAGALAEGTSSDAVTSATQQMSQESETPARNKGQGKGETADNGRKGNRHGSMPGAQSDGAQFGNGRSGGRGLKNSPAGKSGKVTIDFDAMVTQGVISQETRDRIAAWQQENPKKVSMKKSSGKILDILLKAEVITQEEYDALKAATAKTV